MSVVTSMSSLKSLAVMFCKLLAKLDGSNAPEFDHAVEKPEAAVAACWSTAASWVVLVSRTRIVLESLDLMSGVKPVTFAAYLDSATTLPIDDLRVKTIAIVVLANILNILYLPV